MTAPAMDPNAWTEAFRETLAPVCKAQQEGLKALERFAKFQYAVAGDYLQTSLAQAQVALSSKNPAEFLSKQADLGTRFGQKISARAHELANLASETQEDFSHFADETMERASAEDRHAGASSARGPRHAYRRARSG
jgi:phasin family protein